MGVDGEKTALVIVDVATDYIGVDSSKSQDAASTELALRDFNGPHQNVDMFYSDDAGAIKKAAQRLGWSHPRSAPFKHQSNGRAENGVKRVKRGGRVALVRCGLRAKWWPYACLYWAHSHNIWDKHYTKPEDHISSPWKKRFGYDFDGKRIPFGAKVWYKLNPVKQQAAGDFEPSTTPGLFLGWDLLATRP